MKRSTSQQPEGRGFALIVTISLLVLLMVLGVGLLSLSAVTLRSSGHGAARSEAEANARLALLLALAELQKTMGPDSRISARAETLARHPGVEAAAPPDGARAWWVGVSHSDPEQPIGPHGQPVVWLVSGLDPAAAAEAQLQQSFEHPVPMFGDKTIDTASFTGGQPIEAGSVMVRNDSGQNAGGVAYFIDDNGMKAQLAASNPELRNDSKSPHGGGVLPGTYDLSILDQMGSLEGTPMEEYNRLGSLNDLPLIGTDVAIARAKRLGYTTRSRGVLSDVRKGGLKRDLTIAFENESVFGAVFPNSARGGAFDQRYLVMDSEKFRQSRDLQNNGFVHWEMFKDFYNIKKHIQKMGGRGGADYLDPITIDKYGIFTGYNTPFGRGQLGPHDIGPNSGVPGQHQRMPYGDYQPIPGKSCENYKHSPVIPILQRLQMNAWVEKVAAAGRGQPERLKTHVQLWGSHYNPYNITIRALGNLRADGNHEAGLRLITFPQVRFTLPGVSYTDNTGSTKPFAKIAGLHGKRQSHVNHEVMLAPGRSHVCAFENDASMGGELDERLYDDKVRNLTLESVYEHYNLSGQLPGRLSLEVDFYLPDPSMSHGTNMHPGDHEISQAMWAPFAWNAVDGRYPGKTVRKLVGSTELNENSMASFDFSLRTTREGSGAIRPLVDANIRAIFHNSKWDSPLGLPLLAAYSPEGAGEAQEQIFPMNVSDNPKGYTYWGAGRDPADGYDRVILFDIPREDLVSLGQLQHAGVGRFSYEPTYVVGNSYANLRIPTDDWKASVRDSFSTAARGLAEYAIPGRFTLYDTSYLVNEELWDSYIFTTIPQVADNYGNTSDDPVPNDTYFEAVLAGERMLPNPRFLPYEPPGSRFDRATLRMPSSSRGTTGAFYHNAGHLMVDGSFNVNSTSVDAWEAFLSGTHELPYQKLTEYGSVGGFSQPGDVKGVRFPRVKTVYGGPMETGDLDENYWTGFRSLEQEEVRELAEAVVGEIKERGPFLSLGEFVNRKLESGERGERGALQAALDRTVNQGLDNSFEEEASHRDVPADSTQGAGFPGQLLQGDVLQALSPYMTVRSDTFTIRAYGESRNPKTGEVRARAWCEATVQRYPDPVRSAAGSSDPLAELVTPSSRFGRSFRIASFRWLSPAEI